MSGLIALLVGGLVFAAAFLLLTTRRRFATQQLAWYSGPSQRTREGSWLTREGVAELFESALGRLGLSDRFRRALGRAGVDRTPGAFAAFVLLVAAAVFALITLVAGAGWGLVLAVGVPFAALAALSVRAHQRSRAFEQQLPEILDSLSASLRAGHGFDHALQTMAEEVGDPAGAEFRRVVAETHLGRPLDVALREMGERVYSKDLLFVLDSIAIQRQVGGSLAELFELVSETVREREQFRRKLRAITGMVRTSSTVLTFLPLVAAIGLTLVNHSYEAPLFTTTAGQVLSVVTIAMMLVGGVILRRIGSVKP
jgi:tight adherence protein B